MYWSQKSARWRRLADFSCILACGETMALGGGHFMNINKIIYEACGLDTAVNTKKFYRDLTADDIKYIEAACRGWEAEEEICIPMLRQLFQEKMPNTMAKHSVWRRDNNRDIWEYEARRKKKSDAGWLGEGVYFYGVREEAEKARGYGMWLQEFYINVEHPFQMDIDLHEAIVRANDGTVSRRMAEYFKLRDFDGALYLGDGREEWCVLKAEQIKRVAVTRDDEDRIIPLSRRFDLSNPDNRF